MSSENSKDAWVTYAKDEFELKQALILLKSLRNVCTNRKIVLILGTGINESLWKFIDASFDSFVPLDCKDDSKTCFQAEAAIFATSFFNKKLVFLPPYSIVLENADDIFEMDGFFLSKAETGILVLKVDLQLYLNMKKIAPCKKGMMDQVRKTLELSGKCGALDEKFDFIINSATQRLTQNEMLIKNPKIVLLSNDFDIENKKSLAPFFQAVENYTKKLGREVEKLKKTEEIDPTLQWKGYENEPIAIVGMACRMSEANNAEELWKLYMDGKCSIREVPQGRWIKEQAAIIHPRHKKVEAGFLSCAVDEFDSKFFGISPVELEAVDPQAKLLLEIAYEALEDAGVNPQNIYGQQVGVYTGAWKLDYNSHLHSPVHNYKDSFRWYMGNSFGTMSARIAHFLGLTGSNIATESGCSSSAVAVGLAVESLRKGDVEMAVSCGVNLFPFPFSLDEYVHVLSPQYRSKAFDASANGFVRAEGCGVLILKRLSDAIKAGDSVHALIRGYGMSQDGLSKSLGTPTVDGEALAMEMALKDAHLLPDQVQVLEAHGTGTAVGDPLEILAITKVYSSRNRTSPLVITAGKANIGHTESACGIAGIIKTILEMKHNTIPQQILIENLNPKIDLEKIPAEIPMFASKKWESKGPKIAGINSFGITGTNTHTILQEMIHNTDTDKKFGALMKPSHNLLTISAKSKEALEKFVEKYIVFFEQNKRNLELNSAAYSANTGKAHFQHRVAVWGKDCQEIIGKLKKRSLEIGSINSNAEDGQKPNLCFLFTGQGSQFHGMGQQLYESCPVFQINFEYCDKILKSCGIELKEALWGEDITKLHDSLYSQAAIFVFEYCLVQLWKSWGVVPSLVVGHSLGEFAAATTAGILSVEDALKLLSARCRLIDALPNGKMIAVKSNEENVDKLITTFMSSFPHNRDNWLDKAAMNSDEQTTISGPVMMVDGFKVFCDKLGVKTHILDATHAFHSRAMEPKLDEYLEIAKSVTYKKPNITFISGLEGKIPHKIGADYWVRHTREAVQFVKAITACFKEGDKTPLFLEIGPHPVLSALVHANAPLFVKDQIKCFPSARKPPQKIDGLMKTIEYETICETLSKLYIAGVCINFQEFHRYHNKHKVQLPCYPFQRKKYWAPVQVLSICKNQINPMLGSRVESPKTPDHDFYDTTRQSRFHNLITRQSNGYIGDHKIGKYVLMPASGFVETFLAAFLTVSAQEFPIILEHISVKTPFLVEDSMPRELHTVLTFSQDNIAKISSFGREAEATSSSWTMHSESTASLHQTNNKTELVQIEDLNSIKTRLCTNDPTCLEIYKEMADLGYNFGAFFQSLKLSWSCENERLIKVELNPELQNERDLCHPILIDAMVQAVLISTHEKLNALYLPVGIKKFLLFDTSFTTMKINSGAIEYFVHVIPSSNKNEVQLNSAILYKSNGELVAAMYGLETLKTPLKNLEKKLEGLKKKNALPPLYLEEWRLSEHLSIDNYDSSFFDKNQIVDNMNINQKIYNIKNNYNLLDIASTTSVILALMDLGIKEGGIGDVINVETILGQCNIPIEMGNLIQCYLDILTEDGYFVKIGEKFKVQKKFDERKDLIIKMNKAISDGIHFFCKEEDKTTFKFCLDNLGSLITKKESILSALFPKDKIAKFYKSCLYKQLSSNCFDGLKEILPTLFRQCIDHKNHFGKGKRLRILEIGAGNGSGTEIALKALTELDIKYSYNFTDISNAFFSKAKEMFIDYGNNIQFSVLNIEDDPKNQGLPPAQYDLVIAANGLVNTFNLQESCKNVRHLLKNFGVAVIAERFISKRAIDIVFGIIPEYWQQNDKEFMPRGGITNAKLWELLLINNGFSKNKLQIVFKNENKTGIILAEASSTTLKYISPIKSKIPKTWILFGQTSPLYENISKRIEEHGKIAIRVEHDQFGFQEKSQTHFKIEASCIGDFKKLWEALRKRISMEEVEGLLYISENSPKTPTECEEMPIVCMRNFLSFLQSLNLEWASNLPKLLVITRGVFINEQGCDDPPASAPLQGMFRSFLSENRGILAKFIDLCGYEHFEVEASQVVHELWWNYSESMISFRGGGRYTVKLNDSSSRLGLPYPPLDLNLSCAAKRFHAAIPTTHSISDLEFETHNIKPALKPMEIEVEVRASALNFRDVLSVLKPTAQFDNINAIGVDVCGIVVSVGCQVHKYRVSDAVLGCNYENVAIPSHVVLHEDSVVALPSDMTFAEGATLPTVFITVYHCLVTVAQLKQGDTILIHTASGGVGLCAVQIAKDIGANIVATAGNAKKRAYLNCIGVNNVFNSRDLSFGEGIMEATDGKGVNVVLNSLTGPGFKETSLKCCAQQARFVEMSKLNIWSKKEVKEMRGDVKYSVEDLSSADQGTMTFLFGKMQEYLNHSQHPLKPLPYTRFDIVDIRSALAYLEKAKQIGKVVCIMPEPPTTEKEVLDIKLFNERSTYLITGGCGGIGFEVCKWMCHNGARTVVICGRKMPINEIMLHIESLNKKGKNVLVSQCDVGDKIQCMKMMEWIKKELPPLRGIMHSAGCLNDATIPNQTFEKYETTINPKVRGGWNLHMLTKDCAMEHFVMFSSVVAIIGSPGQSNHSACNSYLDALVLYRRSRGLVGSTINWGQWGEVGVAMGKELLFAYPMTTSEGLNALELSLRTNSANLIAYDFSPFVLAKSLPWLEPVFELLLKDRENEKVLTTSSESFWNELNEVSDKSGVIVKYVAQIVAQLLHLDENIAVNQNLQDLGLDSLMMLEFKNELQSLLGLNFQIESADMSNCKSISFTSEMISKIVYNENTEGRIEQRNQVIREDSKLWDTIDISNSANPIPISQVSVVLLSGGTGNLGPYMIQELTKYSQIKKVICLVRPDGLLCAKDRLYNRLKYLDLLEKTDVGKIYVQEGDVTLDLFGIIESEYYKLASEVQAVIHCAVHTSHIEMYGKGASKRLGIKAVNVDGMQRVLEFSSRHLVKHVYSASSLLGAYYCKETLKDCEFPAKWPIEVDADTAPNFGYGISKFIADRLAAEAVKIGIPVKCFRFPKIVGEKNTGRQEVEGNHFFIKFIYFLQEGIMPEFKIPLQVVPVDTCAEISLALFFNPEVSSEMFNIFNPHHHYETELAVFVEEFGPIFKIAKHLWKAVDVVQSQNHENPKELLENFINELEKFTKEDNVSLGPILNFILNNWDSSEILENASQLFKIPLVQSYLREQYSYEMQFVPFVQFVEHLKKGGENTELFKWLDFYEKDSVYSLLERGSFVDVIKTYHANPEKQLDKWCAHLVKYLPDYKKIVPDALEVCRKDFEYAVSHAVEKFSRKNSSIIKSIKP